MEKEFNFQKSEGAAEPLLLSSPHSGTAIPKEIQHKMSSEVLRQLNDTDWYLDQLYSFSPEMGIPFLYAHWHRYVVDLNRSPKGVSLYSDGRRETGLVPLQTFKGQNIYLEELSNEQIQARVAKYYEPYHRCLRQELADLRRQHEQILLFECHSIESRVERIQSDPFPQFILGNFFGKACCQELTQVALEYFAQQGLQCSLNHPFQGGFITREYGQPERGVHALQLEMCKSNYMNEETQKVDSQKFAETQRVLRGLMKVLCRAVRGH